MDGSAATHLIATAADCLRMARAASAPDEQLFYYSAAETLGADDPELWRERHAVLTMMSEPELAFLDASIGPWHDAAVLADLVVQLQSATSEPGIPDTVESLDVDYLVRAGEFERALAFVKRIVRRDHPPHGLSCYLAGVSCMQMPGSEGLALTWLNTAERLDCRVEFYSPYNKAVLLHRRRLHLPALAILRGLLSSEGGFEKCFQQYSYSLTDLLTEVLDGHPAAPDIQQSLALFFHEHRIFIDKTQARLEDQSAQPGTSVVEQILDAAARGDTSTAGTLLYTHRNPGFDAQLGAALHRRSHDPTAQSRVAQLLLSIDPRHEPYLQLALAQDAALDADTRRVAEFTLEWIQASTRTGARLPPVEIAHLIASRALRAASRPEIQTDDPNILELLKATALAEVADLRLMTMTDPPVRAGPGRVCLLVMTQVGAIDTAQLVNAVEAVILLAPEVPSDERRRIEHRLADYGLIGLPWTDAAGWQLCFARKPRGQKAAAERPAEGAEYTPERQAEMISRIWDAYHNHAPFSFIRLSDAETLLLGVGSEIEGKTVPLRPASFFVSHLGIDPDAMTREELRRCQAELHEHCLAADILLTHRRSNNPAWADTADKILRLYPGYQGHFPNEVPPAFQVDLLELGAQLGILRDRRVLLIGNSAPWLKELLDNSTFREKSRDLGMPQSRIDIVRAIFVPHHGDLAFRLLDKLWQDVATETFDVALISASITGKFLAGRIKKHLGRIALDIGYNMQLLANSSSPVASVNRAAAARRGYTRALSVLS